MRNCRHALNGTWTGRHDWNNTCYKRSTQFCKPPLNRFVNWIKISHNDNGVIILKCQWGRFGNWPNYKLDISNRFLMKIPFFFFTSNHNFQHWFQPLSDFLDHENEPSFLIFRNGGTKKMIFYGEINFLWSFRANNL